MIAAHRGPREWNRGCIAWALNGKCGGGAWAVRPTHLSTQLRPAHSVRPAQLNRGPRNSRASAHLASPAVITQRARFAWARALCVGPHILRGLARLAAHALISFSMQFLTHSICYPSKSLPILSKANTIFNPRAESDRLHNLFIMPQFRQSSNRTDGFLTSWHFKTLRNIEIST